ncbi:CinA family protein [Caulobacter endophyticus]|uniref:Damage-inducible protein n=1 Tax=Caulobacter endophyticus TaxID=2172652 RepID=A0A2T9KCP8_9CAUL|nr:CinA family protein [Caulobacter endophyticus]PVM93742.1 damage-inducible protein [Caulobacter endophyticus]
MTELARLAAAVGQRLIEREETVAVAECSAGGLISSALLAVPGASKFYVGGAVVYTARARLTLLDIPQKAMDGLRSASEPYALLLARVAGKNLKATWGLSETGAAGPEGNRYGDAVGHCCVAAVSTTREVSLTVETGIEDRETNMRRFAEQALALLLETLG